MTIDTEKVIDSIKSELDELADYTSKAQDAFRRIADLARDLDESNFADKSNEIFQIAYENY